MKTAEQRTPRIAMEESWRSRLADEFAQQYMRDLRTFLVAERDAGHVTRPGNRDIFRAFELTPFEAVRVVIVGQDPYHGPDQAHGLSFSVPPGVAVPPSLRNIYRELEEELGIAPPAHGNLEHWARQGVLLLNATLTVRLREAGSHQGRGWERFTDAAIAALNREREGIIFLLWGASAKRKGASIDRQRHHVLTAAHPSPLSAHNGFFGCGHFARVNAILRDAGQPVIDWALPAIDSRR